MNSQQVGSLSLQLHLQPSPRSRARLNKGEERRDIRQYGQCLQTGTSTVKRPDRVRGGQLQHFSGRCTYFPAKEVCCIYLSEYSSDGRVRERQPNDRLGQVRMGTTEVFSIFFSQTLFSDLCRYQCGFRTEGGSQQ